MEYYVDIILTYIQYSTQIRLLAEEEYMCIALCGSAQNILLLEHRAV